MTPPFPSRIRKALALLKKADAPATAIISSNPQVIRSRDTHYPYRPNSDLYYLTGIVREGVTLVLRGETEPHALLVLPPHDPVKELWEGAQPSLKKTAQDLGIDIVTTKDIHATLLTLLSGSRLVFSQSIPGTPSFQIRDDLSHRPIASLRNLPSIFLDVENLTSQLRLFKDRAEIAQIRKAAALTGEALRAVVPHIRPGITEQEIGAFIDYYYRMHGAEPAFSTIVGTGKSAATLHYHALSRVVRSGDLVLIDTGAELDMYAADITRTVPATPNIPAPVQRIHAAVAASQAAAIKRVKPGVSWLDVYNAAVEDLVLGLKDTGVLRGATSKLIESGAYRPYFPHGIGHPLGIDVHDVNPFSSAAQTILEPGMVFTIEPGLYFAKPIGQLPACGVRIEDDVLVTKKGAEVLTDEAIPASLDYLLPLQD